MSPQNADLFWVYVVSTSSFNRPREQSYSSTLSLTSTLDGGEWSTPHPATINPWTRPGTHYTGGRVGPRTVLDVFRKSHPQTGFDFLTVQAAASPYTDCTVPAHVLFTLNILNLRCETRRIFLNINMQIKRWLNLYLPFLSMLYIRFEKLPSVLQSTTVKRGLQTQHTRTDEDFIYML